MSDTDSMSAKELANQTFEGIVLAKPFYDLFHEIELKAVGLIWGENYSGKSTFALGLANSMAEFGRIEYVPAEEHFGITLTKKINQLKAYNSNLHFRRYKGLEKLKKYLEVQQPKVVFCDSVTVLSENDKEVVEFAQWCRGNDIGFWMVNHANKDGTYKGNSMLAHETDINVEVLKEDKVAVTRKNRYLGESRQIPVPFTAADIESTGKASKTKKKSKKAGSKKSSKKTTASTDKDDFDSHMDEVEQMLETA
jgi:predicted ATP-dependent serine protease